MGAMDMEEMEMMEAAEENAARAEDSDMYVKFNKPYIFEEDSYDGVDMSGLEDLTTNDLTKIEKAYYKNGITSFNPENTITFAKVVAQNATGLPIEFFDQMPVKEMLEIKKAVVNFFYT